MWNGEEDIESSPIALADTTLCHMLGYTREALVGKPLHTITYFEDAHLSTRWLTPFRPCCICSHTPFYY